MLILFDGPEYADLLPLTFTRPVAELLTGIGTLRSKWAYMAGQDIGVYTQPYLRDIYAPPAEGLHSWINAAIVAEPALLRFVQECPEGKTILFRGEAIGYTGLSIADYEAGKFPAGQISVPEYISLLRIRFPWDLFALNATIMERDFQLFTKGKTSAAPDQHSTILGDRIFIEDGATLNCAIINTLTGPVYLAADAEIQEGAMVRGGLYLGPGSSIKMGAKLYGASSIGRQCKIGGELTNSIFHDYSNKGHEGYLGNSVIGSWCNFGADTNSSNLKNTYDHVSAYSYRSNARINTGQQFLGLLMGDHSKTGINTMFNTGTVAGVSCNIYGGGFPPVHLPSFTWGEPGHWQEYRIDKALDTARKVMARRHLELTPAEEKLLCYLFDHRQPALS